MRSGCQWEQLPAKFGPKSTVHDWFQRWVAGGIFEKIRAILVAERDELGGVQWQWQSADAMLGKARFGGKRRARIPPIAASRAPRRASWSTGTAALWAW
jgi:hypothetical protein